MILDFENDDWTIENYAKFNQSNHTSLKLGSWFYHSKPTPSKRYHIDLFGTIYNLQTYSIVYWSEYMTVSMIPYTVFLINLLTFFLLFILYNFLSTLPTPLSSWRLWCCVIFLFSSMLFMFLFLCYYYCIVLVTWLVGFSCAIIFVLVGWLFGRCFSCFVLVLLYLFWLVCWPDTRQRWIIRASANILLSLINNHSSPSHQHFEFEVCEN